MLFLRLLTIAMLVLACSCTDSQAPLQPNSTTKQEEAAPVFRLLSPEQSGVAFANALPENDEFNILKYEYYYNGGGVAIGDVNGDSLPDLVFTANLVANRLYLNQGNLRFAEASQATGFVSRPGWKTGVTMTDINADGHLDIYVCRSGNLGEEERRNELFLNLGNGTFREAAEEFGLDDPGYSTHAAFLDYDRDGDLDCFVLNHALKPDFNLTVSQVKQKRDPFFGDHLYRNDNGRFTDVSEQAGIIGNPIGFGLSVTVEDFDRDGWLDLFVTNDYTEQDYLYHNQQDGRFREILDPAMAHTSQFSMGSDAGDVDGDGWPDLMVLDMLPEDNYSQKILMGPDNYNKYQMQVSLGFYHQQMRNTLQLNLGKGLANGMAFSEAGQLFGVSNTDWSWSPLLADFDNDGDLDLHITNGYVRASTHLDFVKYDYPEAVRAAQEAGRPLSDGEVSKQIPTIHKPNVAFRNDGPDQGFTRVSQAWGINQPSYSQGAAYGDLDQDGDLDLVVNNLRDKAFLYENVSTKPSAILHLQGPAANPLAIGTVVNGWLGDVPIRRMLMPSRGFQSSVEPVIHIGLGEVGHVDRLEIIWPNGDVQLVEEALGNGTHTITWQEGLDKYQPEPDPAPQHTLVDQGFTHQDNPSVEFHAQPLLPHMPGRLGPCLDFRTTGPGQGEIAIGGGPGQPAILKKFTVDGNRPDNILWEDLPLPGTEMSEVTDLIFFDANQDGEEDLYLVAGGNELSTGSNLYQDILLIREGASFRKGQLPDIELSGGCVAAGDADGDGDPDLFIGGRLTVGAYPLTPESKLLINDGEGRFHDATADYPAIKSPGMISDASWADLDGDGKSELVLLGEWTGVQIFGWEGDEFRDLSAAWGLGQSQGWWSSLEIADLDGDGDQDLITGNLGLNSQLHASSTEPMRMYASDFDQNGTIDPVITYMMEGKEVPIAARDELLGHIRMLQRRFNRYDAYARASVSDIFTEEELSAAQVWELRMLESGWWEQQEGRFVFHPWPLPAQVAPVFGQQVADVNGDGHLDVMLAGNYFPMRAETGRFDASTGLVLYGEGNGSFRYARTGTEQGLWLDGDIRDLGVVDTGDGRQLVLAVRNNSSWIWGWWQIQ